MLRTATDNADYVAIGIVSVNGEVLPDQQERISEIMLRCSFMVGPR